MKNEFTLRFNKNFGDKVAEKIFELQQIAKTEVADEISARLSTSEKILICAEHDILDNLIDLIDKSDNKKLRCYILVKTIDKNKWEKHPFASRCIVRQIPDIYGDYIVLDNDAFFVDLVDENLCGIRISESTAVEKLRQVFLYEFWTFANKEFVYELSDIAEKTFDVPPVKSSKELVLHQGLDENSIFEKTVSKAVNVCASNIDFNRGNLKNIYLNKFPTKDTIDFCIQNKIDLYFTPDNKFNCIETEDGAFVSNYPFGIELPKKRDGRIFLLKIGKFFINGKIYKLHQQVNWADCVGKDLLDSNGKKFTVAHNESENKEIYFDARLVRKNGESAERWEKLLEEKNIFFSEKIAAEITFNVTIKVLKLSFKDKAEIYKEYDTANREIHKCWKDAIVIKIKDKEKLDKDIKVNKKSLEQALSEGKRNNEKLNELVKLHQSKKAEYEKLSSSADKKKVDAVKKEIDEIAAKYKKLKSQNDSLKISDKKSVIEKQEKDLQELDCLITELEQQEKTFRDVVTVAEFENAKILVQKKLSGIQINKPVNLQTPSFDKPKYGTLYQKKDEYEYLVNNSEDFDNAEKEMLNAKIYDYVKFVTG